MAHPAIQAPQAAGLAPHAERVGDGGDAAPRGHPRPGHRCLTPSAWSNRPATSVGRVQLTPSDYGQRCITLAGALASGPGRPAMIALLSTLPIAATALLSAAPAPPREIENVAAFARLYGVVRFFYPSDAAAELDWNRFAVHGVGRVRAARDAAELGATLTGSLRLPRAGSRDRKGARAGLDGGGELRAPRGLALHRPRLQLDGPLPGQADAPRAGRPWRKLRHPHADRAGRGPAREGDPPPRTSAGHGRGPVGWRGAVASRGPTEPGDGLLRQHGRPADPRARVAALRDRGNGGRRRGECRVRGDGHGRRDGRLRRGGAGGQGHDGRLDRGPDPGLGVRGGGDRAPAGRLAPHRPGRSDDLADGRARAGGPSVRAVRAAADRDGRRGALPREAADSRSARRRRARVGPRGPRPARH